MSREDAKEKVRRYIQANVKTTQIHQQADAVDKIEGKDLKMLQDDLEMLIDKIYNER
jgi:hypothetical protein